MAMKVILTILLRTVQALQLVLRVTMKTVSVMNLVFVRLIAGNINPRGLLIKVWRHLSYSMLLFNMLLVTLAHQRIWDLQEIPIWFGVSISLSVCNAHVYLAAKKYLVRQDWNVKIKLK